MNNRPSGLGRGLSALIPGDTTQEPVAGLQELSVKQIHPNRYQPRSQFDEAALESLTASIREIGVLQPVLVRPSEEGFELIAGERRWRAARRAGLQLIPAIVRPIDDQQSLEQAVVENLHRQDLNALEEAAAYEQLIEEFELTQEQVAERVGKSRSTVTNTLRLLQLGPGVQRRLLEGEISAGHARALLAVTDRSEQDALAQRIVDEDLNVRSAERLVKGESIDRQPELVLGDPTSDSSSSSGSSDPSSTDTERTSRRRAAAPKDAALLELERLLADHLSTSVELTMGSGKGRIVIDFADLEDLERIYQTLNPGA